MSWRSRQVDSDCNLHLCCEYHYCSYSQYLDEKYSWWYNWNNYWSWYSSFLVVVHSVVLDYCKAFGGAKDWATLMVIRLVKTWNLFLEFENFTILKNQIFKFFRVMEKEHNFKKEFKLNFHSSLISFWKSNSLPSNFFSHHSCSLIGS